MYVEKQGNFKKWSRQKSRQISNILFFRFLCRGVLDSFLESVSACVDAIG